MEELQETFRAVFVNYEQFKTTFKRNWICFVKLQAVCLNREVEHQEKEQKKLFILHKKYSFGSQKLLLSISLNQLDFQLPRKDLHLYLYRVLSVQELRQ